MSDQIHKKTDNLWNTFSEENEGEFWLKYEKLLVQEKEDRTKSKNALAHRLETTPPAFKEGLVFFPKSQKLAKTLTDFRNHRYYPKFNGRLSGLYWPVLTILIPTIAYSAYVAVSIVIVSAILLYLLDHLDRLANPRYIIIRDGYLIFYNFREGNTRIINVDTIYSLNIVYNSTFGEHKVQIQTAKKNEEFEYKLSKKVHQEFIQYFRDKNIPFDDRYY